MLYHLPIKKNQTKQKNIPCGILGVCHLKGAIKEIYQGQYATVYLEHIESRLWFLQWSMRSLKILLTFLWKYLYNILADPNSSLTTKQPYSNQNRCQVPFCTATKRLLVNWLRERTFGESPAKTNMDTSLTYRSGTFCGSVSWSKWEVAPKSHCSVLPGQEHSKAIQRTELLKH